MCHWRVPFQDPGGKLHMTNKRATDSLGCLGQLAWCNKFFINGVKVYGTQSRALSGITKARCVSIPHIWRLDSICVSLPRNREKRKSYLLIHQTINTPKSGQNGEMESILVIPQLWFETFFSFRVGYTQVASFVNWFCLHDAICEQLRIRA